MPSPTPPSGAADHSPARVRLQALIADPSAAAQQQLARALRRIGLEVQCVVSAAAALRSLAAQHVDLVITESGLADADGFELIRRMRTQNAYRYTPVLLLRSRPHVLDATRARLAGDVTVLTKPLTRSELESVVRETLRNSVVLDLNEFLSPG
jgi:twitching motility two-component system response regulator PilG